MLMLNIVTDRWFNKVNVSFYIRLVKTEYQWHCNITWNICKTTLVSMVYFRRTFHSEVLQLWNQSYCDFYYDNI